MLTTYQRQAKMKLALTVATLVVIAGVVLVVDHLKAQAHAGTSVATQSLSSDTSATSATPNTTSNGSSTTSSTSSSSSTTTSSGFKDGTFSATSNYFVPNSDESIKVSMTLSSGTITNVSVENSEGDPTSAMYQENFAAMYKSKVVGKKISNLQISTIGGASDTTQGFNDAVSQIVTQAQA